MKEYLIPLIIFLLFLTSCSHEDDGLTPIWRDNESAKVDTALYKADKAVFVHDYLEYLESKEWLVEQYPGVPLSDRFFVMVDTILYSKDRQFLFVFYGVGDKGSISDSRPEFERTLHFACESAIGYRDSCQNSITFYENRLTVNSDNYRYAMNAVENYHLKHYKDEGVIASWSKYGNVGYNVDDSLFFDQAKLFQKFNDSLYYFQIDILKSRAYKNMPDSIILRKSF